MRQRFFLFFYICSTSLLSVYSQIIPEMDKEQYRAKVKLMDEFFSRFNGVETRYDLDSELSNRKTNIMLLFDLSKYKSKTDSSFLAVDSFATKVVTDSLYIHYSDSNWHAKVCCKGKLKNKPVQFTLYLKVENRGNHMFKWVVFDVDGSVFETLRSTNDTRMFIMPNEHEQFFSALRKITKEDYEQIDDFAYDGYTVDSFSIFLTLVRCGQLKIEYVDDVEFCFFQIPGYVFTVKHFERESKNAGWLINSLKKLN